MEKLKMMFANLKDLLLNNKKNFRIAIIVLFIITVAILISSIILNPMNAKITRKNYDNVVEKIRKNASKDDYEKVQAVIAMAEMASWGEDKDKIDILEGKSFNQAIKTIQKNIEQEEKETKQQKSINAEKQKIRDGYLKFDNYTWEIKNNNYQENLIITVEMENLKNVDIDAFEGVINISDKLNNTLGNFNIKNTTVIPKKAKADIDMTFYSDEYYSEIKAISRQNGDLYFSFTPTKLIINGKEI